MGYGTNLKNALKERHMTVKELSRQAGISATTLYSVITRDSSVRYDHALRIANVLDINTDLICKENPLAEGATLPELLPEAGGLLTGTNKRSYIKHRTTDILMLYEYEELPQVDQLLANFYVLDDQSREYIFDILSSTIKKHSDGKRKRKLKKV